MSVMPMIRVSATYDSEAGVWCVEGSDLPGLNAEAKTVEELRVQVELAVIDLIEASGGADGDFEVPIELVARSVARSRDAAIA